MNRNKRSRPVSNEKIQDRFKSTLSLGVARIVDYICDWTISRSRHMTSFVFLGRAIECSRTNFIDLCRRFYMKARAGFEFKDDAIF
uniref:Uncharacterized protein n=1 Tax=Helicoverpa zea single nucleopolyhedrovirus TaxID=10468 RepID=A0A0H4AKJ3_9ABAC|nr:hypothetical protein [Helicoverpa zea single nucleopolyhedrovirus]